MEKIWKCKNKAKASLFINSSIVFLKFVDLKYENIDLRFVNMMKSIVRIISFSFTFTYIGISLKSRSSGTSADWSLIGDPVNICCSNEYKLCWRRCYYDEYYTYCCLNQYYHKNEENHFKFCYSQNHN